MFRRPLVRGLVALLLIVSLAPSITSGAERTAGQQMLGQTIAPFALDDFRGKSHRLEDYADSKVIVLAFLGTECPLARLYAPRLAEMEKQFRDQGVTFLAVDPNRQDSISKMAHYARVGGLEFPFLKDTGNVVADQLGIERVPEVVVLDAERVIRYRGRIDDQYGLGSSTGYARYDVKQSYLADAVGALLAGSEVKLPYTEAVGCLIGRVRTADESSSVTYSDQIARIMQNNCVECHREGQIAPFTLTDYESVAGWASMIEEVVREQRMPPWHADPEFGHFANDRSLTSEDKDLIYQWVAAGAPQGDPADLPEPVEFPEGWQMGTPEQIVYMADEPYRVQAEGTLNYQYFLVDPGWTEDKWISAAECMMGQRRVVHHVFVFAVPPDAEPPRLDGSELAGGGGGGLGTGAARLIAGAAPGTPPWISPGDMAYFCEAGTKLLFQMHYTPCGEEVLDRTAVGFNFADPADIKRTARMNMAINFGFRIPPHADSHPVEAGHTFKNDAYLLTMAPHMHLRGKAFRYELEFPDGTKETILNVPNYDFNWQVIYELIEPKFVPAGTKMHCLAHFDNSEENLANPNPDEEVRWGDQTWEEMMIGWFSESTDVYPQDVPPEYRRTNRFLAAVSEKPVRMGSLLQRYARGADESADNIAKFQAWLNRDVPQVDRVCVSVLDGDTVRVLQVSQPTVFDHVLGRSERTFPAAESALAAAAQASEPIAINDLASATESDLQVMAERVNSSLHVPIMLEGKPAVVSYWSKEPAAFPPAAIELLQELSQLVPEQD